MKKTLALQMVFALVLAGTTSVAGFAKGGSGTCDPSCDSAKQSSVPLIKRENLKSNLDNVKLVDALDKDYFERSHVAGSVNIPMGSEANLAPELLPDKDAKIVVYCMNTRCHASDGVAKELTKLGYKNVSIYREGLQDMISSGFPVEGTNPKDPIVPKIKKASK
jgi:rhodanese-related sulfurtransferase